LYYDHEELVGLTPQDIVKATLDSSAFPLPGWEPERLADLDEVMAQYTDHKLLVVVVQAGWAVLVTMEEFGAQPVKYRHEIVDDDLNTMGGKISYVQKVNEADLECEVIESVNVHEDIKLGKPSRDIYISPHRTTPHRPGSSPSHP
jgi:D-mannonate dehydratase